MLNKVEICGVNTSRLTVLSNEETTRLLKECHAGSREAREALVRGNLRLVLSVIQRFTNRGEMVDDLFQVGCIGLIKSIDNFDLSQNVRFSTYAVPMIVPMLKNKRGTDVMTRSEALREAIDIIEGTEMDEDRRRALVEKLELCLRELPFARWSEAAILDACDTYIAAHGGPLTVRDFRSRELPSHTTVKNRFGVDLRQFLDTRYPVPRRSVSSASETLETFRREYIHCGARSRESYDRLRRPGSPCAATVLRRCGVSGWRELKARAGIPPDPAPEAERKPEEYRLTMHFAHEDKLGLPPETREQTP